MAGTKGMKWRRKSMTKGQVKAALRKDNGLLKEKMSNLGYEALFNVITMRLNETEVCRTLESLMYGYINGSLYAKEEETDKQFVEACIEEGPLPNLCSTDGESSKEEPTSSC